LGTRDEIVGKGVIKLGFTKTMDPPKSISEKSVGETEDNGGRR